MTTVDKKRLKNLDFYFIVELREGIYEKIYAKDIAEENVTAHVVEDDRVCFWDDSGEDHPICIAGTDILCD